MDYLFWIVFFGSILAFIVYQCIMAQNDWERRKMLGFDKELPSMDDSIESAQQALHFICDRLDGRPDRWDECKKTGGPGFFTMLDSEDIACFFRYAHFAGCEVVIRQREKKDIEDPKNTPENFKQWRSDMRRARDARLDRKYRV